MLVYVSPTYFRRMFAYIGYLALNTTNYMSGEATNYMNYSYDVNNNLQQKMNKTNGWECN